jgi:hypothetical protein
VLYTRKIYCRVYKNPLATPILSQIKEVHNIPQCLFSINFNIILISTPTSSFRLSDQNPVCIPLLFNDFLTLNPSHHSRLHNTNEILPRTYIVQLVIKQFSLASCCYHLARLTAPSSRPASHSLHRSIVFLQWHRINFPLCPSPSFIGIIAALNHALF